MKIIPVNIWKQNDKSLLSLLCNHHELMDLGTSLVGNIKEEQNQTLCVST